VCPLQVMAPWPGRMRTRATACLRRPVVWQMGAVTGGSFACAVVGGPASDYAPLRADAVRRAPGISNGFGAWAVWG